MLVELELEVAAPPSALPVELHLLLRTAAPLKVSPHAGHLYELRVRAAIAIKSELSSSLLVGQLRECHEAQQNSEEFAHFETLSPGVISLRQM